MPKHSLGTNGKHRANSPTAVRMIRARKRRAEAYKLRLAGKSFREIARLLNVDVSTAHSCFVQCQEEMPQENIEAHRETARQRYETLYARFYPDAMSSDLEAAIPAGKMCAQLMRQLDEINHLRQSGAHLTVNNNTVVGPSAEDVGIQVSFVRPRPIEDEDNSGIDRRPKPGRMPLIEHQPQPSSHVPRQATPRQPITSDPGPVPQQVGTPGLSFPNNLKTHDQYGTPRVRDHQSAFRSPKTPGGWMR